MGRHARPAHPAEVGDFQDVDRGLHVARRHEGPDGLVGGWTRVGVDSPGTIGMYLIAAVGVGWRRGAGERGAHDLR